MRPPWEHSVRMSGDQDVNYTSGKKKRGGGDNSISKLIQENNDILGKRRPKSTKGEWRGGPALFRMFQLKDFFSCLLFNMTGFCL